MASLNERLQRLEAASLPRVTDDGGARERILARLAQLAARRRAGESEAVIMADLGLRLDDFLARRRAPANRKP
jgi:hypothetical protein